MASLPRLQAAQRLHSLDVQEGSMERPPFGDRPASIVLDLSVAPAIAILLSLSAPARAEEPPDGGELVPAAEPAHPPQAPTSTRSPAHRRRFVLQRGQVVIGTPVAEDATSFTVLTATGNVQLSKSSIVMILAEEVEPPVSPVERTVRRVAFRSAWSSRHYRVRVGANECETPCTLEIVGRGIRVVHVTGDATFEQDLPADGESFAVKDGRAGWVVGSAALLLSATALGALAVWLAIEPAPSVCQTSLFGTSCTRDYDAQAWGVGFFALSAGVALIPGIVVLARYRNGLQLVEEAPPRAARLTGLGIAPLPGGGAGATASFSF
jgi:hypothetical protein